MRWLNQVINDLNRMIPTRSDPWWAWPLGLFALAFISTAAALLVYPDGQHEELWLMGLRFGGECGMKVQFGIPCPQCGMTRSWVGLVRGDLYNAFLYNPAGFLLFCWIAIGGLIGLGRLILRKPKWMSPPWIVLVVWSVFWMAIPYMGLYFARLGGVNPLPEYHPEFNQTTQSADQE